MYGMLKEIKLKKQEVVIIKVGFLDSKENPYCVDSFGKTYGMGCPCKDLEDIKETIKWHKKNIESHGDTHIVEYADGIERVDEQNGLSKWGFK